MRLSRRQTLVIAAALILPARAHAAPEVGITLSVAGPSLLTRAQSEMPLQPDMPLLQDDTIRTAADGFAALRLVTEATINLGPLSEITLDAFTAALGGTLTLGGAMVFDRPDDLPPVDHVVKTAFAQIGVRGTKFFAGPSNGDPAVFVERGEVSVNLADQSARLGPGDGIVIAGTAPGGTIRLGEIQRWTDARIAAAYASVGL